MSSTTAAHHPPTAPPPANDELDDLFDYTVNLDDVFRDVDTNMRAPEQLSQPSKARNNNSRQLDSLGIDEAVKVEKKRAPVAKLDEARLLSQAGIPKLRRITKQQLRFKGKGHEYSDVARLLQHYQLWLDELYPKAKFADGLAMIEKLGHSKGILAMRKEWINEAKPRPRSGEEDTGLEKDSEVDKQGSGNGGDLPSASANAEETRRTTPPPAPNVDDDLYSASPQAVRDQRRKDREADMGKTLFISDDEGPGGGPSGDELDALLAEDGFQGEAGTVSATLPNRSHDTTRREDTFDDEMEAMAGMDDLW